MITFEVEGVIGGMIVFENSVVAARWLRVHAQGDCSVKCFPLMRPIHWPQTVYHYEWEYTETAGGYYSTGVMRFQGVRN